MSLPPTAGLGVAWVFGGVSDIQGRYSTGMKSSKMQTGENALMITFAQRFLPWLSIGANFKILRYELPITESDQVSGSGIGFDIGIIVKTGSNSTFGIMVQDLSSNYQWDTNELYTQGGPIREDFPTIYRVGSKYNRNSLLFVWDVGIISDHNTYSGLLQGLESNMVSLSNTFLGEDMETVEWLLVLDMNTRFLNHVIQILIMLFL